MTTNTTTNKIRFSKVELITGETAVVANDGKGIYTPGHRTAQIVDGVVRIYTDWQLTETIPVASVAAGKRIVTELFAR